MLAFFIVIVLIVILILLFVCKEHRRAVAVCGAGIIIIQTLLSYYIPKMLDNDSTNPSSSTSYTTNVSASESTTKSSTDTINSNTSGEARVNPIDLFSTEPIIGKVNDFGGEFWSNSSTNYHDVNNKGGYLYYIFVWGKNAGYDENRSSVTFSIPETYKKLSFTVGVNPRKSTNIGSAWLELRDEYGNLIDLTNQNGEVSSTTEHMSYNSPAESYTVDISQVKNLQITAVPSNDMERGTNYGPNDVGYQICLLFSDFLIQ